MKLTWFGNSTFRIHIGGQIAVFDADRAPDGIDSRELVSGADVSIRESGAALPGIDPSSWVPRKPVRLLDEIDGQEARMEAWLAGIGRIVVDAPGEAPLLVLLDQEAPACGRWVEQAVVVLAGTDLPQRTGRLLTETRPKLVALAGGSAEIDETFEFVGNRFSGTGLIALEPGLAVEA